MKDRAWFVLYLKRALVERKGRAAVAALSVTIATAVIVTALGTALSIGPKLGGELKAYGANIIVSPGGGQWLQEETAAGVSRIKGVQEASGQLYLRVMLKGGATVELMGVRIDRMKGAKFSGAHPGGGEVLLGVDLKDALNISTGETLDVQIGGSMAALTVSGIVETGGVEDGALLLGLKEAQRISGNEGRLSALLVRGSAGGLEQVVLAIKDLLPGAGVRTVKEVAAAEEEFLRKISLLLALVSVVVVLAAAVSVSSTMGATVIERMKEIGLMKALGGTRREIGFFYLAEAAIIGLIGGAGGYPAGILAAQAVSHGAFGSFVTVPVHIGLLSIALGTVIAVAASAVPLFGALRDSPSAVLRGQ